MPILKRNPSVRWRVESHREERARQALTGPGGEAAGGEVEDLGTVTLLSGGVMHQLNLLGGEVWKLCDGTRDRRAVEQELLAVFDVDEATLVGDLSLFLEEMISKGLLREE